MKYTARGGALYLHEKMVMQIKGVFTGPERHIYSPDGQLLLQTAIRTSDAPQEKTGDVRFRQYLLLDAEGEEVACARPEYAEDEDPSVFGWPVCRMPRVDHAQVSMSGSEYCLTMKNSQNYLLEKRFGEAVMKLLHRGLAGGWDVEADDDLRPAIICGIFVLCRYIEQENEFLVV